MAFSKIAASFTMDTSGVESGSRRVSKSFADIGPALSRLEAGMAGLNRIGGTLVFTQLAGLATRAASSMLSMATASAATIDSLSKLGQQTGIAYADMAALEMAGNLAGVGVDKMAAAMSKASKLFDEARRGSASATEAFQRLGLDIADLDRMSSAERFQAIAAAIAALPDPAARAAAAMQIFGRSGAEMLPMFASMAEAMEEARANTQRFGLALTDLQASNVEAMNDSFTKAGYALSGLVTQVTAALAPAIESVVTMLTDMFQPGTAEAFADAFVNMALDFGEVIARFLDLVSSSFTNVFGFLGKVFEYFGSLLPAWSGSVDVWAVSVQVFQRAISLFEGIGQAFVAGIETMTAGLYKVGAFLYGAAATAAEALGFDELAKGARELANVADAEAAKLMDSATARAEQAWGDIGNAFSDSFVPTELGVSMFEGFEGGFESSLEKWRADSEARRKAAEEETGKAAFEAAATIAAAFAAPQFQSAVDIRSKDGYGALLKSMFASDLAAEKQLAVSERQAEILESIRANTEDMDLEAIDI